MTTVHALLTAAIGDFVAVCEGALPEPSAAGGGLGLRARRRAFLVTIATQTVTELVTTDPVLLLPVGSRLTLTSTAPQFTAVVPSDADPSTTVSTTQLTSTAVFLTSLSSFRTTYNA